MDSIKIKARKEVIRCVKCKQAKNFFYLSEFSYGQRLVFLNNSTEYAFIDLIEDKVYKKYIENVEKILLENSIEYTGNMLNEFVNKTYGITCDTINGNIIDFSQKQSKCPNCGSVEFERNMVEPESQVEIDVALISHQVWESLLDDEQKELIENKLKEIEVFR